MDREWDDTIAEGFPDLEKELFLLTPSEFQIAMEQMDIPEFRRNLSSLHNLRWISRNLRIRNSQHPKCFAVLEEIREMIKNHPLR